VELDALLLARLQFAFVVSFHILFPAFTVGLASWLCTLEALWLKTGKAQYHDLYRFWVKIFAVSFGMGVVSGIVMSFQFGTNWSRFSDATGNILGPLMSYEVLTAFFLEAGFLGIMLFGEGKVNKTIHFFATVMVAFGTFVSTFWILSANSWMHTPAGFELKDGIFYPKDWLAIVFNPSFPYRLVHMVLAAYLTTAFTVGGISAWYLLRGRAANYATLTFVMSIGFIAIVAPLQIIVGDFHGLNVKKYQPAKLAAMEGHWDTDEVPVPFVLFAWPDEKAEHNRFALEIPYIGSLVLTHDLNTKVTGLKDFKPEDRPPVAIVFWAFRIMVAIGLLMAFVGVYGLYLYWKARLYSTPWFLKLCMLMTPAGFVAVIAGWFTAEIGRQPYVVYGLMRTAEAASPVPASSILATLTGFFLVYAFVFGAGSYYLLKLIRKGPTAKDKEAEEPNIFKSPARPLSLTDEALGEME
jgi:cytochrome d ubiquinol oxidase subunit I